MTEIDYNIKPLSGLSNILALNAAREDEGRRKRKKIDNSQKEALTPVRTKILSNLENIDSTIVMKMMMISIIVPEYQAGR